MPTDAPITNFLFAFSTGRFRHKALRINIIRLGAIFKDQTRCFMRRKPCSAKMTKAEAARAAKVNAGRLGFRLTAQGTRKASEYFEDKARGVPFTSR